MSTLKIKLLSTYTKIILIILMSWHIYSLVLDTPQLVLTIIITVLWLGNAWSEYRLYKTEETLENSRELAALVSDTLIHNAEKLISELVSKVSELEAQLALQKLNNPGGNK